MRLSVALRVVAAIAIAFFALTTLRHVLLRPHELSTLQSLQVDAAAYDAIARDILTTGSLRVVPPLQPPGFVGTIAAIYAITAPSRISAKVFLWLIFVLSIMLAAAVARAACQSELAAWIAALLTASSALRYYVATIQYEVLAAAWLLALVIAANAAGRAGRLAAAIRRCVFVGVLAGSAALTREVLLVAAPLLAVFVGHRLKPVLPLRHRAIASACLFLTAFAMVGLWATWQSARADRLVVLSDKGPAVLAMGNNPHANGTFNAPAVGIGDPSGLSFMLAEPKRTLWLFGRKVLYFWGVLRDGWNVPRPGAVWISRATAGRLPLEYSAAAARGGIVVVAFVVALVAWPGRAWREWWLLPATVMALLAVHVVTLSSYRFSVPLLPLIFIVIAGPAARAMRGIAQRFRVALGAGAAIVLFIAMQFGDWPLTYRLEAVDMDGLNVVNTSDAERGRIRLADAARGPRPAAMIVDEHLPGGNFRVTVDLRQRSASDGVIALMWMRTADGRPLCEMQVPGAPGSAGRWRQVTLPCVSGNDHVSTLVIQSTAVTDLAIGSVVLQWR